ncbi:putative hydroxymethylpyrimidine transporter CytX [uncultured Fretibacterium sp.]|uniref:putative hydroxymethylpyrimidine transporter CytX n=1 Tax=uncultured Fretibacterium sp. TaxID=1678694 RepID=UPI0026156231|nr:putative hydroxymethylpyrimidine transporter CytX [uncultured Fretibacterium sp.]
MSTQTELEKVSTFSQMLLWFGAAVSIAEILTGALLAPLGFEMGMGAILVGHVIGAALLLPAGLIGAQSGLSAARSVRISFGRYGSYAFSILNLVQLLGWTAIMIVSGAKAMDGITGELWGFRNEAVGCAVIGVLIALWVLIGIKNLARVNVVVVTMLFGLSLVLGFTVLGQTGSGAAAGEPISFGTAVELNVSMSLSWMPLISDYTRRLRRPFAGTAVSVLGYFIGSVLMFAIGLGASLYAGTADIARILLAAGLGLAALLIVLFSTVTTTFLDVYSAGVSAANLSERLNEKTVAVLVCALGTILAASVSMEQYENFLFFIGSVFAPLFSILFVDYWLLGRREVDPSRPLDLRSALLWAAGFVFYRLLLPYDTPVGITLPVMLLVGVSSIVVRFPGRKV